MPIDSRCNGCGKTLRVADEHLGKKAKCPGCGTIYVVQKESATNSTEPTFTTLDSLDSQPLDSSFHSAQQTPPRSTVPKPTWQDVDHRPPEPVASAGVSQSAQPSDLRQTSHVDFFAEFPDGNVYGPTNSGGILRWITEGRLNAQCRIRSSRNQIYSVENFKIQFADAAIETDSIPVAESSSYGNPNHPSQDVSSATQPMSPQSVYAKSDTNQPNPFAGQARKSDLNNIQPNYLQTEYRPHSTLGVVAFTLAIISVILCVPVLAQILGLTAAFMAVTELMKLRDGRPKPPNHGMTVAALIISLVQLVLSGLWLISILTF